MELEYERLRREELESQADLLRKNLQQQTINLELSQNMLQTVRTTTNDTMWYVYVYRLLSKKNN